MADKEVAGMFTPIKIVDGREVIQADQKYVKWEQDPLGYFLIKVDKKDNVIRAGFCNNDNKMVKEFIGKTAEDIYHTMLAHKVISVLAHACNIGRELAKAEVALEYDLEYVQDDKLVIGKKKEVKSEL
ncbi:MAG TPA: DUF4346 domain-containing protein [Candidatus Nanoarchaeia archaeon]|nr:DUF4346 domain-containing protein [Candidatus Nanoarchaeia archaeon]